MLTTSSLIVNECLVCLLTVLCLCDGCVCGAVIRSSNLLVVVAGDVLKTLLDLLCFYLCWLSPAIGRPLHGSRRHAGPKISANKKCQTLSTVLIYRLRCRGVAMKVVWLIAIRMALRWRWFLNAKLKRFEWYSIQKSGCFVEWNHTVCEVTFQLVQVLCVSLFSMDQSEFNLLCVCVESFSNAFTF